jgi:hypothetical protein
MTIGHGAMGLRTNLRTFGDLMSESALGRVVLLEYAPGQALAPAAWTADSGVFRASLQTVFDGIIRDVVGVEASVGPGNSIGRLERVETLAECQATAGTYFYDIDATSIALEAWDQPGLPWDSGAQWDRYPQGVLYVHLYNDADASSASVSVVPQYGFYFASTGCVHPHLGTANKISQDMATWTQTGGPVGGGWDDPAKDWDDGGAWDPTYWSVATSGASATITTNGVAEGSKEISTAVPGMLVGKQYRIHFKYRTGATDAAGCVARLFLRPGTDVMYADGRTADAIGPGLVLAPTLGETRRAFMDLIVPSYSGSFVVALELAGGVGEAGSLFVDDVRVNRIYRFNYYEPRISENSLPETEIASTSIFFGDKAVSLGSASLINGDHALEPIFGALLRSRKPMRVWVGGAFTDGQEVYKEDFRVAFAGYTTKCRTRDEEISFDLEDARSFLNIQLPLRVYSLTEFPNAAEAIIGQMRPMLFGEKGPTKPWRIDKTAFGYGIYEWADTQQAPNGIAGLPARFSNEPGELDRFWNAATGDYQDFDAEIASYVDEENANKPLQTDSKGVLRLGGSYHISNQRLSLLYQHVNRGYTEDNANAQFTVTRSARVVDITPEGTEISWETERGTNTLPEPWERLRDHPNLVEFVRQAIIGGPEIPPFGVGPDPDVTIVLDPTTHKVTVSKPAGFLTLKIATSPVPSRTIWVMLGFNAGSDKTGALSYTGDNPVFSAVNDLDALIIRGIVQGYRDDADGTYTGTPNAVIELGPDIARFILERFAGLPQSLINVPSFVAARSTTFGAKAVTVYISEVESVRDVLSKIEATAQADILIQPDGTITFQPYSASVPDDIRDFYDADYLSWEMVEDEADVFKGVRIFYGNAHRIEGYDALELNDDGAAVRHGRKEIKEITTYARDVADASDLAGPYFRLATTSKRRVEFTACSKLVDLNIGSKIRLSRSHADDPSGSLSAVVFRIQRLRHNYITGVSTCTAIEDVSFL